jgi:hypothetical protein
MAKQTAAEIVKAEMRRDYEKRQAEARRQEKYDAKQLRNSREMKRIKLPLHSPAPSLRWRGRRIPGVNRPAPPSVDNAWWDQQAFTPPR